MRWVGEKYARSLTHLMAALPFSNREFLVRECKNLRKPSLLKELQTLAESDVYWDEIISSETLDIEDVYDATVENVHNFVANDIIVHNSIEQDADIVMFLLRREYYDPYDKPGMAELIVAKNRHGGVGSINFTFRKELARFVNYSPMHNANREISKEANDAFAAFNPKKS